MAIQFYIITNNCFLHKKIKNRQLLKTDSALPQTNIEPVLTKKRDRTASRDARRKQLIEATIDSIAIYGFNKTTLNTVTDIAKLSHGTVNFHFKSKDLLLLETLRYLADEHLDHWKTGLAQAGTDPEKRLKALVATDFDKKIINPKRLAVWFAFWGEVNNRPAYRDIADSKDDERHDVIKSICEDIKAGGEYPQIDSEIFATNLESIVDGLWLHLLMSPNKFSPKQAHINCLTFISSSFPNHFKETT